MTPIPIKRYTDCLVVGSGPGEASVARQLARAGKKGMLLECGKYCRGDAQGAEHGGGDENDENNNREDDALPADVSGPTTDPERLADFVDHRP